VVDSFGTLEAKNRFSELLARAERGDIIAITRHGKVIAHIVPAQETEHREQRVQATIERMRARTAGLSLNGLSIKELINEGRR
jgi:prevent-host-death family protein